jgi:hypothetical protein
VSITPCTVQGAQGLCTLDGVQGCHAPLVLPCSQSRRGGTTCRVQGRPYTVPPTLPSLQDVLGLHAATFTQPLCKCMGAGRKGEGGPFLWGPVCVAPPHKWREGDLCTACVPAPVLVAPPIAHPSAFRGCKKKGGGACVTPARTPLPVRARVCTLLLVTPQTSWIAQGKPGRGPHGKECMRFPSSTGCPVSRAQGRKGAEMGAVTVGRP